MKKFLLHREGRVTAWVKEESEAAGAEAEPLHNCHRPSEIAALKRREERAMALCEGMIDIAAALFGVPGRELRRLGRTSHAVARVRQIAMYAAHTTLRLTMKEVGDGFGRDRTTVSHACHLIEDMRDDPEFDRLVAVAERVALAAFRDRLER